MGWLTGIEGALRAGQGPRKRPAVGRGDDELMRVMADADRRLAVAMAVGFIGFGVVTVCAAVLAWTGLL
jgi:hypothetical protein